MIACPGDQDVDFDANCQFTLPDYTGLATASDNCGTPTVTQSPAAGSVITSTQTITLTASDGINTAECTFDVIPTDNTKPVIACPSDQNVDLDANCQFTLPDYTGLATATDNCKAPTVVQSPAAGTVITSTQTITLTATDNAGLTAQCSFNVIPADNTKPVITCSGDQSADFDANCQFVLPDYTGLATTSDNCSTPTVEQSPVAGTVIFGKQTITLTATDGAGNEAQCTFEVLPDDVTDPVIACLGDQDVDLDGNCEFVLPDYTGMVTASDNCGTATVTQEPAAGTAILTSQTIMMTATDGAGNTAQCTFDVTVTDRINPVLECTGDIETCEEQIVFSNPVVIDNCTDYTLEQTSGLESGSNFPVGVTSNSYTVTDKGGNTASCSFDVTRFAMPTVDVGADQILEAGFSAKIDALVDLAISYDWTPNNGLDNSFVEDPTAAPQQTTTYTLTVTSKDGCIARDDITITVNNEVEVNNFMSPNGDGKNDYWEIKGNWLLDGCPVQIFDIWGDIIYQSKSYKNNWDGTKNGRDIPNGTYYYTISCSDRENKSGSITLKR